MVPLLRTELRRLGPGLLRLTGFMACVGALFWAVDAREMLLFLALTVAATAGMPVGAEIVRDRISGDLFLLSVLPVPAATVVTAKFCAVVLLSLGGAGVHAAVAALLLPGLAPSLSGIEAAGGAFVVSWCGLALLGFAGLALFSRVRIQWLASGAAPLVLLGFFTGLVWILDRLVAEPAAWAGWLLARSWLPAAAGAGILVLAVGVSVVCFRVTESAIRDYRPDPGSLDW